MGIELEISCTIIGEKSIDLATVRVRIQMHHEGLCMYFRQLTWLIDNYYNTYVFSLFLSFVFYPVVVVFVVVFLFVCLFGVPKKFVLILFLCLFCSVFVFVFCFCFAFFIINLENWWEYYLTGCGRCLTSKLTIYQQNSNIYPVHINSHMNAVKYYNM